MRWYGRMAQVGLVVASLLVCAAVNQSFESYYPLQEGMVWEYDVKIMAEGMGQKDTQSLTLTLTNMAPIQVQGKTLYPQKTQYDGEVRYDYFEIGPDGIYNVAEHKEPTATPDLRQAPVPLIKTPLTVGSTWEGQIWVMSLPNIKINMKDTLEGLEEKAAAPAGTFDKCLKIKSVGTVETTLPQPEGGKDKAVTVVIRQEQQLWYAPGTGWVRGVITETVKAKENQALLMTTTAIYELKSAKTAASPPEKPGPPGSKEGK